MKMPFKFAMMLGAIGLGFGSFVATTPAHADYYVYDYDNDGSLNEGEWVDYTYSVIDYDGDGYINENEWTDYTSVWYEPYDYDYDYSFVDYDYDDDGYWDADEYADAYDSDLYASWDYDNDDLIDYEDWEITYTAYNDYDDDGLYEW